MSLLRSLELAGYMFMSFCVVITYCFDCIRFSIDFYSFRKGIILLYSSQYTIIGKKRVASLSVKLREVFFSLCFLESRLLFLHQPNFSKKYLIISISRPGHSFGYFNDAWIFKRAFVSFSIMLVDSVWANSKYFFLDRPKFFKCPFVN